MNVCSKCNTVVETYEGLSTHVCGKQPLKGSCTQSTDNQQLKAETLRCKECETYYGSAYEDLYKCRNCVWYPDVHDYFIQRKASAV